MILEAYYEPQFFKHSHDFRPGRGCHTALQSIYNNAKGTIWFIEGDIKGCFDNISHQVLLDILQEKIHDNRFIRLIEEMLKAGYLEDWTRYDTLSGTPQGGVISPILSNIYLDRLDKWVEETLLKEYTRGQRRSNPEHSRIRARMSLQRKLGKKEEARELRKQMQQLPSIDTNDPNYRRIKYIRYADDFLIGFVGPKAEAQEIKERLRTFLHDQLKLEMSEEKTLITHAATESARFLGYELQAMRSNTKHDRHGRRVVNGVIRLKVPSDAIDRKCALYMRNGKPIHRAELGHDDDFSIVARYGAEYRGLVNYYLLAHNVHRLNKLQWIMEWSMLATLAGKHKTSIRKMAWKYQSTIQTPHGPRKCIQVRIEREGKKPLIATFGGIPLRRQENAVLEDQPFHRSYPQKNEIVKRLLADCCELCGSREDIQVHHVRKRRT